MSDTKLLVLLSLLGALATVPARAQTAPQCGASPTGETCKAAEQVASRGNTSGTQLGAGNPINIITGNKYQREVDLPPLPGVLGLEIIRHYNSHFSGHATPTGILGRGWKLSYETELYAVGRTVQIVQADGTRLIFARDLLDPSRCASPDPAHGSIAIRKTAQGDEYLWAWTNGKTLTFNARGKLVQIKAATGEFVSLQHDARGHLVKVADPQGRALHLTYLDKATASKGDRFRGVQAIDSPVGRFSYAYGSELPPGATLDRVHLLANLVKVTYPKDGNGSVSRLYQYEDARRPTLLTGITVSGAGGDGKPVSQRIATWAYDINGRGILSVKGEPLRKDRDGRPVPGTGIEQVGFDRSTPGQTTITNSLGQATVYRHAIIGGGYRLQEVRGPGCASCGETDVRYGYDRLGRLTDTTKLDARGQPLQTVRRELDHYGRVLKVGAVAYRNGKPQPAKLVMRYEYAAGGAPAPTLIARPSVVADKEHVTRIRYNGYGQLATVTESGWSPAAGGHGKAVPIERSTRYGYAVINGKSLLVEIDGPLQNGPKSSPEDSDITRLSWDAKGNAVTTIATPGNFKNSLQYDEAGRIAEIDDTHAHKTTFAHDARHRLTAVIAGDVTRKILYDASGNPVETGYDIGHAYQALARFGYDNAGRQVWAASRLGILQRARYDSENRILEAGNTNSRMTQVWRYAYDVYGRLTGMGDNRSAHLTIAYDQQGRPTSFTDALGRIHLIGQKQRIDAGMRIRRLTDDFGRVIATVSPDAGTTTHRYDPAGRLVASADAQGNSAIYEYDTAGRIARQTITDGRTGETSATVWRYQGKRLVALEHPSQSEQYRYNERGLLAAKTVRIKRADGTEIASVTRYAYSQDGTLQSVSLPDGSHIAYERNDQGQVTTIKRSRIQTGWLQWLLPATSLVSDLERDLVGLKHYKTGNGIEADIQRSREGALARIVYRINKPATLPATGSALDWLIEAADAAEPENKPASRSLPGALGSPQDPKALLDLRYLWDAQGNLLHLQQQAGTPATGSYAYDDEDRLIVAAQSDNQSARTSRYFYDSQGRRRLSQQGVTDQRDLKTNTEKALYQSGTHRWLGENEKSNEYDANGQPARIGQRDYRWDALGRLIEVRQKGKMLARYAYNHRGERIAKDTGGATYYLYQDKQLAAELDSLGKISRQYVYLADTPIAVIDKKSSAPPEDGESCTLRRIAKDLATILQAWLTDDETMTWLHTNHLGAIEAATSEDGKLVWRASYQPSGQASVTGRGFILNLRLPGQYEDAETGLHYNGRRYYDPQRGAYLTPDPLGTPDGPNPYAYVRNNPLRYIDPSGLILFAFDGTGNSEDPPSTDSISNVRKFLLAYDQQANGEAFYITGIGTTNQDMPYKGNILNGDGFDQRVALGFTFLDRFIEKDTGTGIIDIDVVGFSRGAAEARVWINHLVALLNDHAYSVNGKTRCVNLRFVGLWDTVSHLGYLNGNESGYGFAIPDEVKFAAQANALNEYRGGPINFDFRSIMSAPASASSGTRIEKGFLGSHADIGGGFGTGDLSNVALMWMIDLARSQGIKFDNKSIVDNRWNVITSPLLHDKSSNLFNGAPEGGPTAISEDRDVLYTDGTVVKQRQTTSGTMAYADTISFITYKDNPLSYDNISGTVDIKAYLLWLNEHGYNLNNITAQ